MQFQKNERKFWKRYSSASESAFPGFLDFFVCSPPFKRGVLLHKNSLASCQRCHHSVESRAVTYPFKQSHLSAWSLLSWLPTHTYLWGRLCFIQVVYFPPSRSRRVTRVMSTEALLLNASLESFLITTHKLVHSIRNLKSNTSQNG